MFSKKSEFINEKSEEFNKDGASEALKALAREFGSEGKNIAPDKLGSGDIPLSPIVQRLVDKLPPHLVQNLGTLPEKLSIFHLSKGLSDSQKKGIESLLSCSEELAKKRLDLLDRVLTKYIGDSWNKMKEQDFLEVEVLLEAWDFTDKFQAAKDFIKESTVKKEGVS